jgi:hypothetical protein
LAGIPGQAQVVTVEAGGVARREMIDPPPKITRTITKKTTRKFLPDSISVLLLKVSKLRALEVFETKLYRDCSEK